MKDLFGDEPFEAYARRTDPQTSHAAAESIRPQGNRLETQVANAVGATGGHGATCDDIVDMTGLNWNTVSPRLKPLCRKGVIRARTNAETGKVVTRLGRSNRAQTVWITCGGD